MSARKFVQDDYVPTAEYITAHEDALMSQARRDVLNHAIAVLNLAMPKPPPPWANTYLSYLLRQLLDA